MKKKILGLVAFAAIATIGLAACGSSKSSSDKKSDTDSSAKLAFPEKVKNSDKAISGGTLNVAIPYDTQFQGVFSLALYEDAYDAMLMEPAEQYLFNTDENFKYDDTGLAAPTFDEENKKVTIKLKKDLKWSDGEDLTTDDVIYAYEVVGNKDYTGVRYDDRLQNIIGMEDYHAGKASTISGIKKVDDQTVEISYKEMSPGIEYGSGLLQYAMPKHYLSDVPIADLVKSDKIRKNPVTTGPYYISNVKTGESVEYKANKYYYKGEPKIKKMVMTIVPTATIVDELKSKKYDIALDMPSDTYESYKSVDGYQNLGRQELYYSYIGFKFGKFDKDKDENVSDSNAKMSNKSLRKAIAYSIDTKQLGEKVYGGLRTAANSVIVPSFGNLYDKDLKGYTKNTKKAEKLLDDAGYKDTDGDGFREDPDGKALTINFAAMSGTESAQTIADYYKQSMEDIGLKVAFTSGRLMELNSFYDKILGDSDDVDMYAAAWGVGTDPNPSESFSRTAQYNMMRFTSDKMDTLLKNINSSKSFDTEYQEKAYKEFQQYVYDEAMVIPINYNYRIALVNDRVKNYTYSYFTTEDRPNNWFNIELTAKDRK